METNTETKKGIEKRYLEWYQKNFGSMKEFWIKNFVYPLVFPSISVGILRYIAKWQLSNENWFILFMLLYAVALMEKLLSRLEQLIKALDKIIGEKKL